MVHLVSDNCISVHPAIMDAIMAANHGHAPSYGYDAWTDQVEQLLSELFETKVLYTFTATGSAANALSLSLLTPSYGAIFCHRHAHIQTDEYGAPGFFTGGAQTITLDGPDDKIPLDTFDGIIRHYSAHMVKPAALTLTQATEAGTVYRLEEIRTLADIAHSHHMRVHMDGARFANALVHLGCSPAEMTWKSGVDVMSLGATKNGCMAAEAVLLFGDALGQHQELVYRRKQSGQTLSKMRFIAAQFLAYLENDRWLTLAAYANAMAALLGRELAALGLKPLHPVQANEVFVAFSPAQIDKLHAQGHRFMQWHDGSARFVTSFATTEAEIQGFLQDVRTVVGK